MKYRKFKDFEVSALGLGCMRLPTTDGNPMGGNIDEDEAIKMIRYAINEGVNYIDTAYPYHAGKSEIIVGKSLKDGYRKKIKLATKSPVWYIHSENDFDKYLDEQLEKLQTDYIDYYLLHALDAGRWKSVILKYNVLKKAEDALRDGRIKHLGFSFHDGSNSFKEIIDGYDKWEFCQIQYNFMDVENQAGLEGLNYANSLGIPVVIMEPLLGGKLANPVKGVIDLYNSFLIKRTPADWALKWIWNHSEVSTVLSGTSSMDQLKQNIDSAKESGIGLFKDSELELISSIRQKYQQKIPIICTNCGYCLPCPNGVNIPKNFMLYNEGFIHENFTASRATYKIFMSENERAANCIECGECEEKCPQKLKISELMPKVHTTLNE